MRMPTSCAPPSTTPPTCTQRSDEIANEKNRALKAALNTELRKTKAMLLEQVRQRVALHGRPQSYLDRGPLQCTACLDHVRTHATWPCAGHPAAGEDGQEGQGADAGEDPGPARTGALAGEQRGQRSSEGSSKGMQRLCLCRQGACSGT